MDQILQCPKCQSTYTTVIGVEYFHRILPNGIRVAIAKMIVNVDDNMTNNPSPRRDAVIIRIECEECQQCYAIRYIQHKGQTFIEWESAS